MPDGDQVCSHVPPKFREVFEEICEWHYPANDIAYDLLKPATRIIKTLGDDPIGLIFQVAAYLEQLPRGPILGSTINWCEAFETIENYARQLPGQKRAMGLALAACKSYLSEFQDIGQPGPHLPALLQGYLVRVYEADFEHSAKLDMNRTDLDHVVLLERLNEVRPFVLETLAGYANSIMRSHTVGHLRRPSRLRTPMAATTNLLKKGKR